MVDASPMTALYLREPELRRGMELLFFAYRDFTQASDSLLGEYGFGHAHRRALYFIAKDPGLTVSCLLRVLRITKQSLNRVLNELQERGFVEQKVGVTDRRQRRLFLTEAGAALERQLFEVIRARMAKAYANAGPQAVAGFWLVLDGLMDAPEQSDDQQSKVA